MIRLGWSYRDLCECPEDVLETLIDTLEEIADGD